MHGPGPPTKWQVMQAEKRRLVAAAAAFAFLFSVIFGGFVYFSLHAAQPTATRRPPSLSLTSPVFGALLHATWPAGRPVAPLSQAALAKGFEQEGGEEVVIGSAKQPPDPAR